MTTDSNLADRFEELVFRFEDAWNQAPPPRIEEFLPLEEPLRMRVLEELLLIDADRRMQLGEAVSLAEYVARLPELSTSTELSGRLQRLIDERQRQNWCVTDGAGRYRVIEFHAKGGLGQVSTAADEQLKRTVAIKEIQPRFAGHPVSRQRFLEEAEITGTLEHPGIVPVYGAGTFADGRPYYVMRFIQGTSLTEAIAAWHAETSSAARSSVEHALEFRKLLRHFIAVCDAVQYAHDRGILHRDLKPSNIMLGKYGETFVVDWGLAKAMNQGEPAGSVAADVVESTDDRTRELQQTQPGDKLGTLDYMSPEQAAGRQDQIGVASDLYGLGATLYQLLTGVPPFHQHRGDITEAASSGQSPSEALRRQLDRFIQRVAAGEFPRPRAIKPNVPRALEAICLKAMSLRPSDRYGSVRHFASDLECWLADEAVTALPDSWQARLGRWARRHRAVVAALIGLLSTAVTGLAIGTVLLNRERSLTVEQRNRAVASEGNAQELRRQAQQSEAVARAEANRANEQAQRADKEAQRAAQKSAEVQQVAKFLVDLFRSSDPLSLRGSGFSGNQFTEVKLTANDLLQRGVQRIEDLKAQPLVQATLLENLGDIHRNLGHYELAKRLLDRAWERRQTLLKLDDPAIAEIALSLGRWHQDQGHFREAKEFYDQALSIRLKHWPDESLPVAEIEFHQAWLIADRDRQAPAAELFRKVLRTREKLLGPNHPDTQAAKVFLAVNLLTEGREIEGMMLMASDLELAAIPKGILDYRAAESLRGQGRYDEARARLEPLVEEATKTLGQGHPVRALLVGCVAGIAQQQGKFADARQLTEESMSVLEPLLRNHPRMARPAAQYARGMWYGGYLPLAEKYLRHALKLALAGVDADVGMMQGETHESTIALGRVLLAQGKYDEVRALYDQGYPLSGQWKNYDFRADCVRLLGQSLVAQGNPERAAPYLAAACRITGSLGNRLELSDLLEYAECLREAGHDELAEAQLAKALRLANQWDSDESLNAFARSRIADVYGLHDRVDDAERQLRLAVPDQDAPSPRHPHAADQTVVLARFLRQLGKLDEAEQLLVQAERDLRANVGPKELPTTAARLELARVHQRRGNIPLAAELARSALADRTQLLGAGHPAFVEAQLTLVECLRLAVEASRAEALELLKAAHSSTRRMFGPGHPRLFEIVERHAELLRAIGQTDEAIELLDSTLKTAPPTLPRATSTSVALLESVRGAIFVDRRDFPAAESLLKSSHHRLQLTFGRLDERTQRSFQRLVRLYELWGKPAEAKEYRRAMLR